MSTIILRGTKGSPLTNSEVDANFTNINTDKLETSTADARYTQISNNLSDLASASTALTNLGLTATAAEVNYTAGVTSSIQTQIDALQRPSIAVTVAGGKFYLDGTQQQIARLIPSVTYKFDQSDSTNDNHPLLLSTTSDGTHGGGTAFTVGVTSVGVPGTAGAYTEVKLEQDAPDTLYYYCGNHPGMGGEVTVRAGSVTLVDLGVTASASELNTLSGITASTSEINALAGIPATLTATELGYVDGVTSSIQTQIDSLGSSAGTTLTKTFTAGETSTITLSDNVLVPVVSVTKEVAQTGVSNNDWNVNSTTENYTRYNSATAVTLTPSAVGDGTFTLGSGSFSSADVGKTIVGNGGVAVLTATDGSYTTSTNFSDTSAIASGSWEMYAMVFNTTDGDLELSAASDVYNFSSYSQLGNQAYYSGTGSLSGATSPVGISVRQSNGTKFWTVDNDADKIIQWSTSGFSDTTPTYDYAISTSSQTGTAQDISVPSPGNYIYIIDSGNVFRYNLASAYNLNFQTSHSQTYNSQGGEGLDVSDDGTKFFIVKDDTNQVKEYTMSTPYDLSTASNTANYTLSDAATTGLKSIRFKESGTRLFIIRDNDTIYEWSLSTGYDLSTVSFVGSVSPSLGDSTNQGFDLADGGKYLYTVGSNARHYVGTIGTGVSIPSGYHAAHTNTSTDSTYWTDINSMTANEAAGSGSIYYCVSTDNRTTWKIAKDTDGERSIVRNNSGTWQYNSDTTYGSTTWADATVNEELYAIQEAMDTAANQMNKTQLDAVPDANHFTLANDLDLAVIMTVSSGETVPSSDGVAINYDASVLNQGAILGTDYTFDAPAQNKVRITSVNGANLKVRVI